MNEIFRAINDNQKYLISTFGNVQNVDTGRIMKQLKNNTTNYKFVGLRRNNKTHFEYVHRLVATEFSPNPDSKRCVKHIDGNRENNTVENLKWISNADIFKESIKKYKNLI